MSDDPIPTKWCSRCRTQVAVWDFHRNTPNVCAVCKRKPRERTKLCLIPGCGPWPATTEYFYKASDSAAPADGLMGHCKKHWGEYTSKNRRERAGAPKVEVIEMNDPNYVPPPMLRDEGNEEFHSLETPEDSALREVEPEIVFSDFADYTESSLQPELEPALSFVGLTGAFQRGPSSKKRF